MTADPALLADMRRYEALLRESQTVLVASAGLLGKLVAEYPQLHVNPALGAHAASLGKRIGKALPRLARAGDELVRRADGVLRTVGELAAESDDRGEAFLMGLDEVGEEGVDLRWGCSDAGPVRLDSLV